MDEEKAGQAGIEGFARQCGGEPAGWFPLPECWILAVDTHASSSRRRRLPISYEFVEDTGAAVMAVQEADPDAYFTAVLRRAYRWARRELDRLSLGPER